MYIKFKVKKPQKEPCRSSLIREEDMETIEVEVEDDLEVEDEVRLPVITVDNLDIWQGIVNNILKFIVTIVKLRIMLLKNVLN